MCTVRVVLQSNTPPRALLVDFGFLKVVPDPAQPIAHSAQLEGGLMTFMPPEFFIPEFGGKRWCP